MRAVIGHLQGNELLVIGLPLHFLLLARELQWCLDCIRSAEAEEHPAHPFRFEHFD
ncbi:hypothetical protein PMI06_000868 [Burkholderia sp. BT03]|nr:hypothetical protein PMI06_000868 [Burkholderia sp. BT03]